MMRVLSIMLSLLFASTLSAQTTTKDNIKTLDQLLQSVKQQQAEQRVLNQRREQSFLADKKRQQQLLAEARRKRQQQIQISQPLLESTEANSLEIEKLQGEFESVIGDMGELSSTFKEFSGDFAAVFQDSLLSAQFPDRMTEIEALANIDTQVNLSEIESLWLLLQEDMTEASKTVFFKSPVIDTSGVSAQQEVLRIGPFSAFSSQGMLRYVPETTELLLLSRQPSSRYRVDPQQFAQSDSSPVLITVDPSRGSLLGMLNFTPDLRERIEQAGVIGAIIIALGIVGCLLMLWRIIYLSTVSLKVKSQLGAIDLPKSNNPLGRVLLAVKGVPLEDEELLQLKLDEAVLAQMPALERGNGVIKLLAATSPLLGLLGTVTGMILTFQAISLFGTGDPKLMAGGISQALMTTVLGLIVAIPLLFGHAIVSWLSKSMIQRLDEQCAGVLARSAESGK